MNPRLEKQQLGKVSADPSKVISEKGYLFCDFLVIGSGPTGLLAALILANSGKSVILMEQDFVFWRFFE